MHGNGGSPALVDDVLVFSCDGADDPFIVALDRADGQQNAGRSPRERRQGQTFSFCTPLVIDVDGQQQIISPAAAMSAPTIRADGREIWRVDYGEGFSVIPRPVFAHGLLFVCSGYTKANLLAIDPKGASGDVDRHARPLEERSQRAATRRRVLVVGDEVYFVSDNGVATCLDARTGKQHWTERLGGGFSASPRARRRPHLLSQRRRRDQRPQSRAKDSNCWPKTIWANGPWPRRADDGAFFLRHAVAPVADRELNWVSQRPLVPTWDGLKSVRRQSPHFGKAPHLAENFFFLEVRRLGGDCASGAVGKSLCGLEFGGGGGAAFGSRRLRGLRQAVGGPGVGRLREAHCVDGSVGRPTITAGIYRLP